VLVVVNTASGTLRESHARERLRNLFREAGLAPRLVEVTSEAQISAEISQDAGDTVVAAGGDGTVNAVAARLAGTPRVLGVIAGGTLNHFAKDLRIPLDFPSAVALLRARPVRAVDVGEVNGRVFLNNSSIGMYPQIVRYREKIQMRGFRKWTAFAAGVLGTIVRWPVAHVRLEVEGRALRRSTPFVFVGNNRYELEGLRMGSRATLSGGELCICAARQLSRLALVRMMLRGLRGGLRDSGDLDVLCARRVSVDTRRRVHVALDGQVVTMRSPLHYAIRPAALNVIAP
jgi:diacylglycerol kinase family enzyme